MSEPQAMSAWGSLPYTGIGSEEAAVHREWGPELGLAMAPSTAQMPEAQGDANDAIGIRAASGHVGDDAPVTDHGAATTAAHRCSCPDEVAPKARAGLLKGHCGTLPQHEAWGWTSSLIRFHPSQPPSSWLPSAGPGGLGIELTWASCPTDLS